MTKNLTKPFLLILVFLVLLACYFVFRPFLTELFVAIILVSIFYRPYQYLVKQFKGRKNLAALLMCLILVLVVVLPVIKGIVYASQKSVVAYSQAVEFFNNNDLSAQIEDNTILDSVLKYLHLDNILFQNSHFQEILLDAFKGFSNWLIAGATTLVKGTTNFIISLLLIIVAMFFFFVDGKNMLYRLMRLSPLPDKYDREIFNKFRRVSYTTFISTFLCAAVQGVTGAIGFAIVGFPPLFAGILVGFLSLFPYLGSMIFYVPVGVYFLLTGDIWQGVFLLSWGMFIIGTVDDFLRAYLIKDKAEVNMIFVLFSIFGGLALFGFWGILLGPLIVALAVTIFHIYELEFCEQLDNCNRAEVKMQDVTTARQLRPESFKVENIDNNLLKSFLQLFKKKEKNDTK